MKSLDEPPKNIAPLAFGFEIALAMVAALLGWLFGHSPLSTLELTPDGFVSGARACGWGALAALPPLAGFFVIDRFKFRPFHVLQRLVDEQIVPLFSESRWWEIALVSVAAGVGEELLFRGLLQDGAARSIGGTAGLWIGLGLASIVFGLCHALNGAYAILATLMGLYLGLLFVATNSVLAVVVTHAAYDFVVLAYLLVKHREAPPNL